jgi:hypothetical protein
MNYLTLFFFSNLYNIMIDTNVTTGYDDSFYGPYNAESTFYGLHDTDSSFTESTLYGLQDTYSPLNESTFYGVLYGLVNEGENGY